MDNNQNTESARIFIEGFLANLRKPLTFESELCLLIEQSFLRGNVELLHEFAFAVKNFRGMLRGLRLAQENKDMQSSDSLLKEIAAASKKISLLLEELVGDFEPAGQERFRRSVLPEAQEEKSAALQKFFADVEQLKNHFNDLKRAFEADENIPEER